MTALAATPALMPAAPARRGSVDVACALTVTAGLAAAVYAIVRAPQVGWGTAETLLVLAGAAALLATFMGIPGAPPGTADALGMTGLALVRPSGSFVVDVLPASLLAALGMSLVFIPSLGTAISSARPEEGGLASGIVNTSYQVGSALGLAAMTAVAASRGADQLGARLAPYPSTGWRCRAAELRLHVLK